METGGGGELGKALHSICRLVAESWEGHKNGGSVCLLRLAEWDVFQILVDLSEFLDLNVLVASLARPSPQV